jgi:FkbM family methyltransferase
MSAKPELAALLYGVDVLHRAPVTLFDVGCSGGVERHWLRFGEALHAVGFDPLVAEVNRLNSESTAKDRIRYEAAFVGCAEYDELFPRPLRDNSVASKSNASFERTSAAAHAQFKKIDYIKETFNRGEEVRLTDRKIELDAYAASEKIDRVDFLKVDTDGHDIEVLLGAREVLKRGCLAVCVEAQFHGAINPRANTFSNIDLLLRDLGFTLFDLEPIRYTRSALPGEFCYDLGAQTTGGAIQWAEAIYARDLGDPNYVRKHEFSFSSEDVYKLACFFDIFGLQDCAAELLLSRRDLISRPSDRNIDDLLNVITPNTLGSPMSYQSYISAFRQDPSVLFPSRLGASQMQAAAPSFTREQTSPDPSGDALAELDAMKRSLSWRTTAPLRRISKLLRGI